MTRFLTSKWMQFFLLLGVVMTLAAGPFFNLDMKDRLKFIAFDNFNRLDPRAATDQVIIVDIDEETLRRVGQWPLPRTILADLVKRMKELQVKATVFDMVFAEPDRSSPHMIAQNLELATDQDLPNYDSVFAQAIEDSRNVVTGFVTARAEETRRMPHAPSPVRIRKNDRKVLQDGLLTLQGVATNLPELPRAAAGNGIFLATPSTDGIIRQIPLLVEFQGHIFPTLSLEALRVAHNRKEFLKILRQQAGATTSEFEIQIGESGMFAPIERDGKFWVKYRSMDRDRDYLSMYKILDPAFAEEAQKKLQGRIAFIGTSAEGLKDIRSTPLNIFIPGVEVHANVAEQILQGDFLYRYEIIADNIEALFILVIGFILIILSLFSGAVILTLVTIAGIGGAISASYYAYLEMGMLFDPAYPSLALLLVFILTALLNYIRSENQAREIRGAFGLYISPDFMAELTGNPDKLKLGGEMRELTIMFTDIRSFTTISESLTPEELINTMNDFLTPMSDEVMNTRGTIDKYMGDAMMAFWNAPLDDPDHARHAVQAALNMKAALDPVNKALADKATREGTDPLVLAAGIGVNTGLCSVGNMGSKQRFAYSALGDAVNLASRLEGQTKSYGLDLLVGEETAAKIPDFAVIEMDKIQVKGKTQPVQIYTVLGNAAVASQPDFKDFAAAHARFIETYRAQNWKELDFAVQDCLSFKYGKSLKAYYDIMLNRVKDYQKTPPPADWDGTFIATSK